MLIVCFAGSWDDVGPFPASVNGLVALVIAHLAEPTLPGLGFGLRWLPSDLTKINNPVVDYEVDAAFWELVSEILCQQPTPS